jgi:hypothetical protein
MVTRVLEAPLGAVVRLRSGPDRLSLVQAVGPGGYRPGQEYTVDRGMIDAVRSPEPLLIEDRHTDDRFSTSVLDRSGRSVAGPPRPGWARPGSI